MSITCSFCNKDRTQVNKLIAGSGDVYICNECIDICSDTIHQTPRESKQPIFDITEQIVYCAILQNYDDRSISQMREWLEENIEKSWVRVYEEPNRDYETYKIIFESESDLVAFKLRWI